MRIGKYEIILKIVDCKANKNIDLVAHRDQLLMACKAAVDWHGLDGDSISDPTLKLLLDAICPLGVINEEDLAWAKSHAFIVKEQKE